MKTDPTGVIEDLQETREQYEQQMKILKERIRELDSAIESLGRIYNRPHAARLSPSESDLIQPGLFDGKTLAAAARKYLELVEDPRTSRQIWDAISRGGIKTNSVNPTNVVTTTLNSRPEFRRGPENTWLLVPSADLVSQIADRNRRLEDEEDQT